MVEDHSITGSTAITLMDQMRALFWTLPRLGRIAGVVALVGLCLLLLPMVFFSRTIDVWVIASLIALLMWPVLIALFYWRLAAEQKQLSYEINSKQIVVRDGTGSVSAFPWSVVRQVTETNSGFSIWVKPAGARWLVKRAFTMDAIESLRILAKEKLGEAARLTN